MVLKLRCPADCSDPKNWERYDPINVSIFSGKYSSTETFLLYLEIIKFSIHISLQIANGMYFELPKNLNK